MNAIYKIILTIKILGQMRLAIIAAIAAGVGIITAVSWETPFVTENWLAAWNIFSIGFAVMFPIWVILKFLRWTLTWVTLEKLIQWKEQDGIDGFFWDIMLGLYETAPGEHNRYTDSEESSSDSNESSDDDYEPVQEIHHHHHETTIIPAPIPVSKPRPWDSNYNAPQKQQPHDLRRPQARPVAPKPIERKKPDWYRVQRLNPALGSWQDVGAATNILRNATAEMDRQMSRNANNQDKGKPGVRYRVVNKTTGATEISG